MNFSVWARGVREIAVVFLGATLLFLIQPIAGQRLLAAYGGSPSVWLATLLFFQLGLFLGYAWGFLVAKVERLSGQMILQMGLLTASVLLTMPVDITGQVVVSSNWKPLEVILVLASQLALPVICLGSVSPLIQSWGARIAGRRPPYWLYAISNLASLFALVAYPFWIQPSIDLNVQQKIWSIAFLVFVLVFLWNLMVALVYESRNDPTSRKVDLESETTQRLSLKNAADVVREIPSRRPLNWLLLSFLPSILLMATTNQITSDVAAGPLFWTLPLAAYLATFTLAFAFPLPGRLFSILGFVGLAGLVVAPTVSRVTSVSTVVAIGCSSLFLVSLECHRRLAQRQPDEKGLPAFYLWIALGGLLGGVVSNLIAPILFSNYYELELAVLATAIVIYFQRLSVKYDGQDESVPSLYRRTFHRYIKFGTSVALASVVLLCVAGVYTKWPIVNRAGQEKLLVQRRTFHGVLRVIQKKTDLGTIRTFGHGWTDHGSRLVDGPYANLPSGYYSLNSGASYAFSEARSGQTSGLDVCVLGLGAGSLLSWKKPEDHFEFVEIDSAVVELQQEYFSEMNVVRSVDFHVGDGRQFLEDSTSDYDLIVLDAFTGDSVPTHLLTEQAMEQYLRRCRLGGVIAVNVSNRYLDFCPVLLRLANRFNLDLAKISYRPMSDFESQGGRIPESFRQLTRASDWVILSRVPFTTAICQRADRIYFGNDPLEEDSAPLWRDDFSPILPLLK